MIFFALDCRKELILSLLYNLERIYILIVRSTKDSCSLWMIRVHASMCLTLSLHFLSYFHAIFFRKHLIWFCNIKTLILVLYFMCCNNFLL